MSALSLCGGQGDTSSRLCLHVLSHPSTHVEAGFGYVRFPFAFSCVVLEKVRLWQIALLAQGYLQPPGLDY